MVSGTFHGAGGVESRAKDNVHSDATAKAFVHDPHVPRQDTRQCIGNM